MTTNILQQVREEAVNTAIDSIYTIIEKKLEMMNAYTLSIIKTRSSGSLTGNDARKSERAADDIRYFQAKYADLDAEVSDLSDLCQQIAKLKT